MPPTDRRREETHPNPAGSAPRDINGLRNDLTALKGDTVRLCSLNREVINLVNSVQEGENVPDSFKALLVYMGKLMDSQDSMVTQINHLSARILQIAEASVAVQPRA